MYTFLTKSFTSAAFSRVQGLAETSATAQWITSYGFGFNKNTDFLLLFLPAERTFNAKLSDNGEDGSDYSGDRFVRRICFKFNAMLFPKWYLLKLLSRTVVSYHWRALPQVSFLSRQARVCHDKSFPLCFPRLFDSFFAF